MSSVPVQHELKGVPKIVEPERCKPKDHPVVPRRKFETAEEHVGAQDRGAYPVDLGDPARIPGIVQREHAAELALGLDFDPIRAPFHDASATGAAEGCCKVVMA